MTSLASWFGADQRGPASLYIASDSRMTWNGSGTWDLGRKTFAAIKQPEIFGYCGDVVFPTQILAQLVTLIDLGLAFPIDAGPETKLMYVEKYILFSLRQYPQSPSFQFSIIYGTRSGIGMAASFHVWQLIWEKQKWNTQPFQIAGDSTLLVALGSGASSVKRSWSRWEQSDVSRTSRAVFSAFCDSVSIGGDPASGGAPQLVGLYRSGPGRVFGMVYDGGRYCSGASVPITDTMESIEWRNCLFERCDGVSGEPLPEAQRHARPKKV